MKQFLDFLKSCNVIGLAPAVIIGGKANTLAGALVNDLVTPPLLQPALRAADMDHIGALSAGGILYGKVLAALLDVVFDGSVGVPLRQAGLEGGPGCQSVETPLGRDLARI